MKIHLLSHTQDPIRTLGAAILSLGTGKGATSLDQIAEAEAIDAIRDTCRSQLTAPLEFASFVLFWEDVPIFLVRELQRHRVGWSYAEQSLRFAVMGADRVERFPTVFVPSLKPNMIEWYKKELARQVRVYQEMLGQGMTVQDARTILGVWIPTHLTTACTYRALRDALALRQTSQAHPVWQEAVYQIKEVMRAVHPVLAEELRDICEITGRCVWMSKLDRPCSACEKRGMNPNHVHAWKLFHDGWEYCTCGERRLKVPSVIPTEAT